MNAIAIITARGGSKRIPKKNIRDFCGKPILAYSIEAALQSGLFAEVMVSTDSPEIASVAARYGAEIPFPRAPETSNDYASTADVLREVIGNYQRTGKSFDTLCCLYPTAPFVSASRLCDAFALFQQSDADSLIPVVRFSFPPQRAFVVKNGRLVYQYPECALVRSQDLEPVYHDCGQFYFCRTDAFLRYGTLVTPNAVPLILPETEVQDIDSEEDWTIAEEKYRIFIGKKTGGKSPDHVEKQACGKSSDHVEKQTCGKSSDRVKKSDTIGQDGGNA